VKKTDAKIDNLAKNTDAQFIRITSQSMGSRAYLSGLCMVTLI